MVDAAEVKIWGEWAGAKDNNIKKGAKIIEEINSVVKSWKKYAEQAGVRNDLKERISANLHTV